MLRAPIIIEMTPEYPVVELVKEGHDMALYKKTWPSAVKWAEKGEGKTYMHYIGLKKRPGVLTFCQNLEYRYFPPDTDRNQQFKFHAAMWEGMEWMIISIPAKVERFARKVADEVGLNIRDAVPMILEVPHVDEADIRKINGVKDLLALGRNHKRFPIHGANTRTLEYPPGSPMPTVLNEPGGAELLRFIEARHVDMQAEKIVQAKGRN